MKKKMKKRWLALLMSMLMAVTAVPVTTFANEQAEVTPDYGMAAEEGQDNVSAPAAPEAEPPAVQENQGGQEDQTAQENQRDILRAAADNGPEQPLAEGTEGAEEPAYLTDLKFAEDSEGSTIYPITPKWDKEVREYTMDGVLKDYEKNFFMFSSVNDPKYTVYLKGTGETYHSSLYGSGGSYKTLNDSNPFVYVLKVTDQSMPYWDTGAFDANEAVPYQVTIKRTPTLKNLQAGETMRPSVFDRDVREYSAVVDADAAAFSFTATGYRSDYTITAGGITKNSGEPIEIPLSWDENGQMKVPITVSTQSLITSEYTLNLTRAEKGNEPYIMANPEGGQKYADAVETEDVTPLKTIASANGTLTYQWYRNGTDSTEGGTKVDGATESVYYPQFEFHEKSAEYYFYCEVTNTNDTGSYTAKTSTAHITVIPDPTPYDIQFVYEDGSPVPLEGITISQGDPSPIIKALFKSRIEGGITEETQLSYYYYIRGENGKDLDSSWYGEDFYEPDNRYNMQGTLYCNVTLTLDGVKYMGRSAKEDTPRIVCTVCGTSVEKPRIYQEPSDAGYLVGAEELNALTCAVLTHDNSQNVKTTWQWMVSEDEGENKTFDPVDDESASGSTELEIGTPSIISYIPQGSDRETIRYYKCRAKQTLESYNGKKYTSYADTKVVQVSFQTLESIVGEDQKVWEGQGTEASPYQISSAEDLELLRQVVNEKGVPMRGMVFSMTKDITLPEGWIPIGSLKEGETSPRNGININPFSGIFDGGGYTLTVPEDGKPLFGYVRQATVRNMNLYGTKIAGYGLVNNFCVDYGPSGNYSEYISSGYPVTIEIDHVTIKTGTQTLKAGFIGGYASAANIVNIRNCTAEAGVVIGYTKELAQIGSFAGNLPGTMENCTSAATVYGTDRVGGLAGSKGEAMGPSRILNCSFTGTVEAAGKHVGGIYGSGYTSTSAPNTPCVTIKNCYVTGNITGGTNVGGIIGAEPACKQCWANGAGYIQNNHFSGTVKATEEGGAAGGIIGCMRSLDRYNIITNNYFRDGCGADQAIAKVDIIDTTAAVTRNDAEYTTTEQYARSDDPLGADAENLGKAQSPDSFKDGTVTAALNSGEGSFENWKQGDTCPVFSEGAAVWADSITLSGYKTEYTTLEDFTTEGIQVQVTMSNGTVQDVPVEDVDFSGYLKEAGTWTVTASYKGCTNSFTVRVAGASDQDYADAVSGQIGSLGEITLDSREAVEAAKAAYEALSEEQKALIENYHVLEAAEQLLTQKEEAAPVAESIRSLGTITEDSREAVEAARQAYDALSEEAKQQVDNYVDLILAEKKLVELTKAPVIGPSGPTGDTGNNGNSSDAASQAAAGVVSRAISAIGEVSLADRSQIEAVRASYEALSPQEKALVEGLEVLEAAEKKLAELTEAAEDQNKQTEQEKAQAKAQAKPVEDLIASIGKPSLESKEKIEAARAAYDRLEDPAKAEVSNLVDLINAEKDYAILEVQAQAAFLTASVDGIKNAGYTGRKITFQKLTVTAGGRTLTEGQDYSVSYKKNQNIGTAQVIISGKGIYKDSFTKTFQIQAVKGKTYKAGGLKYKVLSPGGKVSFAGGQSKTASSLTIPAAVKIGGRQFDVTEIGAKACKGCKNLKNLTIKSQKLTKVGGQAIKGIHKKAVIKTPSGKRKQYQKLFTAGTGFKKTMRIQKIKR